MFSKQTKVENAEEPSNFEAAIEACGFGLFNICLLLAMLPGLWGTMFETTTMSYVFPTAECDLDLSLMEKGVLNAITFGGTLLSAIPWGFIADTFSRKYVLIIGLLAVGTLTSLSVLSQTAEQLMMFKFFSGFVLCGPVAGMVSYASEFHGVKYRLYIIIVIGFINDLALLVLPIVARSILPDKKNYYIGSLEIRSWKVLILITAVPSFISGFLLFTFPESPKFLMSQGKNDAAFEVFKTIYAINNYKHKDTYPIAALADEDPVKTLRRSTLVQRFPNNSKLKELVELFYEGLEELRLLCTSDYIKLTLMICCMMFALSFSANTIGLWQPQNSAISEEMREKGYTNTDTCTFLGYLLNKTRLLKTEMTTIETAPHCEVDIERETYMDNIIIGGSLCCNYILATLSVVVIGNHNVLRIYLVIACVSQFSKYWSTSHEMSIALSSINSSCNVVCASLVINASINLYPTTVRTMTVIFLMSFGRLGGVIGNLLFPLLMALHCIAMFLLYSITYIFSLVISFFVENTTKHALK